MESGTARCAPGGVGAGLRDPSRHGAGARGPEAAAGVPPRGHGVVRAPRRGRAGVDPRGVLTGPQYSGRGAARGPDDRGASPCPDRRPGAASVGPGRGAVSPGAAHRRLAGYRFLEGVRLRVRRPSGRNRVQRVGASGVRADGTRHRGEPGGVGGPVPDRYRRGLEGRQAPADCTRWLCRVGGRAADGLSPSWASARRGDHATMKADAQTIDPAASRSEADHHAQAVARRWRDADPPRVTRRRARSPRVARLLPVSAGPLADAAEDPCDGAGLRGSPPSPPSEGMVWTRAARGADSPLHL